MSRRKAGIGTIEINKKFKDENEAELYMKRLAEYIRYISKKKKYKASAMMVISNMNKGTSSLKYINNKKGRPSVVLEVNDSVYNRNWYKGNYNVKWHIHILLLSSPSYALRNDIKKYVDKNWNEIDNLREIKVFDINKLGRKKVYKKKSNINIAEYFIEQSSKRKFINVNYSNEDDFLYSIKDYYLEYMLMKKRKIELVRKNIIKFMGIEKYEKELDKIVYKYNLIRDYMFNFSKENDKKYEDEFNDNIKNDNKLQKNRSRYYSEIGF